MNTARAVRRLLVQSNVFEVLLDASFITLVLFQLMPKILLDLFEFVLEHHETIGVGDGPAEEIIDLTLECLNELATEGIGLRGFAPSLCVSGRYMRANA